MTIKNRILSVFLVPVFILGVFVAAAPAYADDGYKAPGQAWVSNPVSNSAPRPAMTAGPASIGNLSPVSSYANKKPYTTSSCYSCGWGSYPSSLSYDRDSYFALTLDFSDNDIDQSVTNNITNNVIGNTNSNIGINNSQETNQYASITNGRTEQSRSGYYSYFDNFRNGHSTSGNSNSSSNGQNNNANQSNIFNSSSKGSHDHDDDDDDNDSDLDCELDVSDSSVDEDDRVTLSWDTEGAVRASINQGIGRVDEDGGSERVTIDDDTTFRMTVEDEDGDEETCSVSVRVGDENDFSSIVIDDEPVVQNPYSAVYLSDIPYTGFDLGPYAWAYWAAIAGLIAAGAYGVFFMGIPFVLRRASASIEEAETEIAREDGTLKSVMTLPSAATTTGTAVIASQSDVQDFVEALVHADDETASQILEDATKDGVSASVFLNRASALLRSGIEATKGLEASVIENLVLSLETAAKARA